MKVLARLVFTLGVVLGLFPVGVPAVIAAPVSQETVTVATPEDLPFWITYQADKVLVLNRQDADTAFEVSLRKGEILLPMGQDFLQIFGGRWTIDPVNHPDQTQVFSVVALTDNVSVSGLAAKGVYARFDFETVVETANADGVNTFTHEGKIAAAERALLVQISRTRIPGNCVATGCAVTRGAVIAAYNLGEGTRFDLVFDKMYVRP